MPDLPDPALLRHHGDVEVRDAGLLDLAVNVHPGPRPAWLDAALRASLDDVGRYPDATPAEEAIARHHGRPAEEVLATAGAAEALTLIARRPWRRPVVVHPQFTEPHVALTEAGHRVEALVLAPPFALDPGLVPAEADLVVVGNPTNPTGVLHDPDALLGLCRPGRTVVVDEAFVDAVPGQRGSLAHLRRPGLVVLRSLTKHWSIPGVRAGYLLADADLVAALRRAQAPWSVSTAAVHAMVACTSEEAARESERRAVELSGWRDDLLRDLHALGVDAVASSAPFVLARPGAGVHAALRERGVAVRRCDTFPGLDGTWLRVAARPPQARTHFVEALRSVLGTALPHPPRVP